MRMMVVSSVVLDFLLYPRGEVNPQHVHYIAEALAAGAKMPPIVIDAITKRVVDGFHRVRAYIRLYGENHKIEVIEKRYKSDAELFVDAMRFNNHHGAPLSAYDKAHCVLRAEELKITPDQLASALNITVDAIGEIKTDRMGTIGVRGSLATPLKRTIRHMAGQRLTKQQEEVNGKLSGMPQRFYAQQLILILKSDLLDRENETLMKALVQLHELLGEHVLVTA